MELATLPAVSAAQRAGIQTMRVDHFSSPNSTVDTLTWGHGWDGVVRFLVWVRKGGQQAPFSSDFLHQWTDAREGVN